MAGSRWRAAGNRCGVRALCLAALALIGFSAATAGDNGLFALLKPAPSVLPVDDTDDRQGRPDAEKKADTEPTRIERHPARQAIDANPIHDPANPDRDRLQNINDATRNMKRDAVGFPDWMSALHSGAISPREGLLPGEKMNVLNLDVVMRNTKEMAFVRFPHLSHTLWLDCSNCHPAPFIPKAGANPIDMAEIFRGRYCGMCHDRVAFITFFSCERCHSIPRDGGGTRP